MKVNTKNSTYSTFFSFSPHNQSKCHQYKDTEQEEQQQEVQDHDGIWFTSSTFKERIDGGTGEEEESARENDPTFEATATFLQVW